jgi:uncharacterized protein (TIGR03437 family)
MKQKCLAILCMTFASAAGAYAQITLNSVASKAVGQPQLIPRTSQANLVEGRELNAPSGLALDTSVTPPVLYVSDTFNNRVMVWKNASGFSNGQAADVIIGQVDQYSTAQGGGPASSTGLAQPSGLAVQNGNLYVADTGNNRILRFPKPYNQTTGNIFPDMWIGQASVNGVAKNYTGAVSATGLNMVGYTVGLAFDSTGGLWATDSGNNRVIHYPASALTCTNCGGIAADTVLGQTTLTGFTTSSTQLSSSDPNAAVVANEFNLPGTLAIDANGNLYVADSGAGGYFGRILIFSPPFVSGGNAARIMGVTAPGVNFVNPTAAAATTFAAPSGIFFFPSDNAIGVLDTGFNRILIFPPFNSWKGTTVPTSPQATSYYGQTTYQNIFPNGSATRLITPQASSSSLWAPSAAVVNPKSNEVYVADSGNNRVLALPLGNDNVGPATRVLGQDLMNSNSTNLIEGREFDFTNFSSAGEAADAGIAIDNSGPTPHLYVADTYNNRILGFKDLRTVAPGARADIVIGQPNFTTALCNYNPSLPGNGGDIFSPTQSSLCQPKGLAVDAQGNLYVADSGNGRVLRFPAPFSNPAPLEQADLVLGQNSFTAQFLIPSATTMSTPYGLAFSGTNGLLVSDQQFNRVLYFKYPTGNSFRAITDNGIAAVKVFGQPNFTATTAGATTDKMSSPHHIACDSNGQLYVADTGNSRIMIFQDPNNPQTPSQGGAAGTSLGGFSQAQGIYVNPTTGEIWVANTNAATAQRYPQYATLLFNPTQLGKTIQDYGATLALAQDQFGDLVIADSTNRISVYFPQATALSGANFEVSKPQLAPQLIASLFPVDSTVTFGANTGVYTDVSTNGSWPTTLDDIQVQFNGTPAPIDFVSPSQINFLVPNGAPVTGAADVEVVQKSTGQVFAAGQLQMTTVSPGMFICPLTQTGAARQACIVNQDGTVNTTTAPAPRGSTISIYMTGLGYIPNAPADGQPDPGILTGQASLDVVFSGIPTGSVTHQPGDPKTFVSYVGLAPGYVGLWQVNVTVPLGTPPGTQIPIGVFVNGNVAEPDKNAGYQATVAIK